MKKFKKTLSLILALATILSLSTVAFATKEAPVNRQITATIRAQMNEAIISVHGIVTDQTVVWHPDGSYAIETTYSKPLATTFASSSITKILTKTADEHDRGGTYLFTKSVTGTFTYNESANTCSVKDVSGSVTNYGNFEISNETTSTDTGGWFTKWAKATYKFTTKSVVGRYADRSISLKVKSDGSY